MADEARQAADPDSPLYQKAITPFDQAEQALEAGDHVEAYQRFREARDLFTRALAFDRSLRTAAEQARASADHEHPRYRIGQEHFVDGQVKERLGDYRAASEAYELAAVCFSSAVPYDPTHEQRARTLREEAHASVERSYAEGERACTLGQQARQEFRYDDAYRYFQSAQHHFLQARFDPGVRVAMEEAKRDADPSSPSYARGLANEQEGCSLLAAGNGPGAASRFRMATISYAAAARGAAPPASPAPDLVIRRQEEARERAERQARDAASRSRKDALGLKDSREAWERDGRISTATLIHYREGRGHWEAAETARTHGDWGQAETQYRAAIDCWLKVSSRSR
jgi:tetratricopeptide (TPR) repeat protein